MFTGNLIQKKPNIIKTRANRQSLPAIDRHRARGLRISSVRKRGNS